MHKRLVIALVGIAPLILVLASCAGPQQTEPEEPAPEQAEAEPETEPDEQDPADSAQAMADRLSQAMAGSDEDPFAHIDWQRRPEVEPTGPATEPTDPGEAELQARELIARMLFQPWLFPGSEPLSAAEPEPEPLGPDALDDDELFAELTRRIASSRESDFSRAVRGAGLSLAHPSYQIDRTLLEPLSRQQRDAVQRYHKLLMMTRQQLAEHEGRLDRAQVEAWLGEMFQDEPIEIRRLELCRRVTGYGIYEPFERYVFLAGQPNRMIVYAELDHFTVHESSDERKEVRLEQEVVLYNASDGLAVWRQRPVEVVDESRNHRRDFFVVQMITLPARLSVGRYQLKLRVRDMHGNTVDESTLPIELVADEQLLEQ